MPLKRQERRKSYADICLEISSKKYLKNKKGELCKSKLKTRKDVNDMKTKFKNSSGKIIGKVSGDVFSKRVIQSKHLFRALDAWGMDKSVIDNLVREGVKKIVIHEKEGDIDYEVSVEDFVAKGIEGDFGHGKQIFLARVNFKKVEKNRKREDV